MKITGILIFRYMKKSSHMMLNISKTLTVYTHKISRTINDRILTSQKQKTAIEDTLHSVIVLILQSAYFSVYSLMTFKEFKRSTFRRDVQVSPLFDTWN